MSINKTKHSKMRRTIIATGKLSKGVRGLAREIDTDNFSRMLETALTDLVIGERDNSQTPRSFEQETSTSATGAIKKNGPNKAKLKKSDCTKSTKKSEIACQTELPPENVEVEFFNLLKDIDDIHHDHLQTLISISQGPSDSTDLDKCTDETAGEVPASEAATVEATPSDVAEGEAPAKKGGRSNVSKGYLDGVDSHEARIKVISQIESQVERTIIQYQAEGVPGIEEKALELKKLQEVIIEHPCGETQMLIEVRKRLQILFSISNLKSKVSGSTNYPIPDLNILNLKTLATGAARVINYVTMATGCIERVQKSNRRLPYRTSVEGGVEASFCYLTNFIRLCNYVELPFDRVKGPVMDEMFQLFFNMQLPQCKSYHKQVREIAMQFNNTDIAYAFRVVSTILTFKMENKIDKVNSFNPLQLKFLASYGIFIVEIVKQRWLVEEQSVNLALGMGIIDPSTIQGTLEAWFRCLLHINPDSIVIYVLAAVDILLGWSDQFGSLDSAGLALLIAVDPRVIPSFIIQSDKPSDVTEKKEISLTKNKKKHQRKKAKTAAAAAAAAVAAAERAQVKAEQAKIKDEEAKMITQQVKPPVVVPEIQEPKVKTTSDTLAPSAPVKIEDIDNANKIAQKKLITQETNEHNDVIKKEKRRREKLDSFCEPTLYSIKRTIQAQAPNKKIVSSKKKNQKNGKKGNAKGAKKYTGKQHNPRHDTWSSNVREPIDECSKKTKSCKETMSEVPAITAPGRNKDKTLKLAVKESINIFTTIMDSHFKNLRALLNEVKRFCDKANTDVMSATDKVEAKNQCQKFREDITTQCEDLTSVIDQIEAADNNKVRLSLDSGGVILNYIDDKSYELYRQPIINCNNRAAALGDQLTTIIDNL